MSSHDHPNPHPPPVAEAVTTQQDQSGEQQQPLLPPISDQWDDEYPDEKEWLDAVDSPEDDDNEQDEFYADDFDDDDDDDDDDEDDDEELLTYSSSPEFDASSSSSSAESDSSSPESEGGWSDSSGQSDEQLIPVVVATTTAAAMGEDLLGFQSPRSPDHSPDDRITQSTRKGALAVAQLNEASAELDDAAAGFIEKIIHARRQSLGGSSGSGSSRGGRTSPTRSSPSRWAQSNRTSDMSDDPPPPTQSPMRTPESTSLDNRPRLPSRLASDDPDSPEHLTRARFVPPSETQTSSEQRESTTTAPADTTTISKKNKQNTSTSSHTSRTSLMTDASLLTPLSGHSHEEEIDPHHSGSMRVPPPPLYQQGDDDTEDVKEEIQSPQESTEGRNKRRRRPRGQAVAIVDSESGSDPSPSSTSSEHLWFEDKDDASEASFFGDPDDVESPSPEISKGSSSKHSSIRKPGSSLSEQSTGQDNEQRLRLEHEEFRKRVLWLCLLAWIFCSCLVGAALLGGAIGVFWIDRSNEGDAPSGAETEVPATTTPYPYSNTSSVAPSAALTEPVALDAIRFPNISNGTLTDLLHGLHEPLSSTEAIFPRTPLLDALSMAMTDGGAAIHVDGTPQNRAYQWLIEHDSHPDDVLKGNVKSAVHIDAINLSMQKITQRFALATFYFSTNGDEWDYKHQWMNKDLDECFWSESSFNSTLNDTSLGAQISCGTSATMGQAKHNVFDHSLSQSNGLFLTRLELIGNNLTGVLPPEIGLLSTLEQLVIMDEGMTYSVDEDVEEKEHNLAGFLLSELGLLTKLEALVLTGHDIAGSVPPEIGAATSLTVLNLRDNGLTGHLPLELAHLTKLEKFDVSSNDLQGVISESFEAWTAIREFQIQFNSFNGSVPDTLCNVFYISSLSTPESPVESFADCPNEVTCPCCRYCCSEAEVCTVNWDITNSTNATGGWWLGDS